MTTTHPTPSIELPAAELFSGLIQPLVYNLLERNRRLENEQTPTALPQFQKQAEEKINDLQLQIKDQRERASAANGTMLEAQEELKSLHDSYLAQEKILASERKKLKERSASLATAERKLHALKVDQATEINWADAPNVESLKRHIATVRREFESDPDKAWKALTRAWHLCGGVMDEEREADE